MYEEDERGRFKQSLTPATCSEGHKWTVSGKGYESGHFDPDNQKDLICPECGKRGKLFPE